jgi:hypothetical protein
MNHFMKISLIPIVLLVFLLPGCSTTSVTGVWSKSDYTGQPLQSILVVALTGDSSKKTLWENIMADQLNQSGLSATPSIRSFPGDPEVTKEEIINYVNKHGIEGVLVTRLVDTKKEKVYYPPEGGYYDHGGRYGYYNRFGSYYPHAYNRVTSPGYTTTHTTVLLETNLYLTENQELIWSMSSDTFDPKSMNQLVESVSKKVIETLQKGNLIVKPQ